MGGPEGRTAKDAVIEACAGRATATFVDMEVTRATLSRRAAELTDWYRPRWRKLGWQPARDVFDMTKEVDGVQVRAFVLATNTGSYAIDVERPGSPDCSPSRSGD